MNRIAFFQGRRDEIPNQEAARELARTRNASDIREMVENLTNKEPNIQSDCLKVLYELGYLAPELIATYVDDFLKLLSHRNNRMVWGGMIALSTIASLQAGRLFPHIDKIEKTMDGGTVITNDAGIKTLADVAAQRAEYQKAITPFLLERLAGARPVDAPRIAENILHAVGPGQKAEFIRILEGWINSAPASRQMRLKKVLKQADRIP